MGLADQANQYVDTYKPWQLMKEAGQETLVHEVCSLAINLFKIILLDFYRRNTLDSPTT